MGSADTDPKPSPNIWLYLSAGVASGLVLARVDAIDEATVISVRASAIDDRR
jgi:hypothetical protein